MNTINDRLRHIIDALFDGNKTQFAKTIDIPPTSISNYVGGQRASKPSSDMLERIVKEINISSEWLLTGEGKMLKSERLRIEDVPTEGSVPFYENLPVSAGQAELVRITEGERPSGYIQLPGVRAIAAFPVVGCSMEPEIKAGDFVAITPVDNLNRVDPDKTYMIVTEDDRMIKHLMIDNEDDSILWAVSPNYPKFRLRKKELIAVYRINFVGKVL